MRDIFRSIQRREQQGPAACRLRTHCLVAAMAVLLGITAAQAAGVTKPSAKPVSVSKEVAASSAPGFAIAPRPAWVQPASLEGLPALPAAPVQVLLMDDQTRVGPGGSVRFQHAVRQITSTTGLEAAAQVEFIFDPSYERLTLHELVIWRDGKRLDRLDRKVVKLLQRETQLERQIVDGRMTASIVLEDLRVGDRIEWSASLSGDNPVFEGRFVDTQWLSASRGPVGLLQRRLLAPAERKIRHRVSVPDAKLTEQLRSDGWREVVVRRLGVPQFRYDPMTPAEDNFVDLLEWSEFESWAEVAAWADRQFAPALRDREALAAKAAEIRAAEADPERRLDLALDFVQKEVRYFGTEIGASSHRPALASQVMRQRFGDCKDKAALLVNLLAQLDIEAVPALVSTTLRRGLEKRLPSPLNFDHAIVAVRRGERWLWLDATRSMQTGPAAERAVAGLSSALLARSGETAPLATPLSRDQLRAEVRDVFSFPRLAEPGELVSEATYFGDVAEQLRMARAAQPAEAFEAVLLGDLARAYPGYQRQGEAQVEDLPNRNALRVTLRLRGSENWRLAGKGVMASDAVLSAVMAPLRLPDMTPREQALAVGKPGTYRHWVRFDFGEQAYARDSEQPFVEANDFFELKLRSKGGPRFGEFSAELQLRADRIESAQWSRYRDTLQKVWPLLARQIALPMLPPERAESFRSAMKALDDKIRNGRLKVATRVQANAHFDLLVADHVLAGQRLSPKLQARVQSERGQNFDHLGMQDAAKQAFEAAIRLDPSLSEAQAGLAVNALIRGQDADAQHAAEQALQLAPNDTAPRYTRAQARFMAGNFAGASEDLRQLLQEGGGGSETERGYRAIWLFLAQQAQGQDGRKATMDLQVRGDKPSWPHPVLRMLRGEQSLQATLASATEERAEQAGRECEIYFFAAQKALLERDVDQARRWLERSMATGVVEFIEYGLARREHAKLASR